MFATGLAGGVYAPVNVRAPLAKRQMVCSIFEPDVVIAPRRDWPLFEADGTERVYLDPCEMAPTSDIAVPHMPRHDLAYVIFTSGSTGQPKGVEISRSALNHYVAWLGNGLDLRQNDRVSQYANIAFDLSVMEIYGALCHGASLHPPGGQGDRLLPARLIQREQLTHWISVPSVVTLMQQADDLTADNTRTVRRFVFCGEPLTPAHVSALFAAAPHALVQNTYGPTEATVSMTSLLLKASDLSSLTGATVPLGLPIPGMGMHLVGGPDANEGELVLTGPQLANGYFDDSTTTSGAFRILDTADGPQRAYFTGDWAIRVDGQIFFSTRVDFQVKHKGFRIELGELSAALIASGAAEACVFSTDSTLVALIEVQATSGASPQTLRSSLISRLDLYAVPDDIVIVNRLPRNDNDKIDRGAAIELYRSGLGRSINQGRQIADIHDLVNVPISKSNPKTALNR